VSEIAPDESASTSIGGDVNISDEAVPSIQLEYFVNDNWSVELLCCVATHDVAAVDTGLGRVDLGRVTHFPPTVTLKHRWTNLGRIEPYVGAGVNYTRFIDNDPPKNGVINHIDYSDSWGPALQAGLDYRLNDHWAINLDVRKLWISTDVDIDSAAGPVRASVDIDPVVVTTALGYRF
jgi:outer membrane protein